ncbi:hypothetical protein CH293_26810 [Rhodococcus sp. 14-2470-1b]|nr:hypothetical protein CH293_26810 [Rhodococcus sp. 14-2470-1b]
MLEDGLPNGEYTVGYRVTSADGHPITGSYGFSVDVAATATPQDAAAQQSQGGATSTSPTPVTTATQPYDPNNPSASEDRPPKQNTMMLLSIVGLTVLGLAAIALTLVIRGKDKQ